VFLFFSEFIKDINTLTSLEVNLLFYFYHHLILMWHMLLRMRAALFNRCIASIQCFNERLSACMYMYICMWQWACIDPHLDDADWCLVVTIVKDGLWSFKALIPFDWMWPWKQKLGR